MASYLAVDRKILCDGNHFMTAQRPEMAADMADTFNEIARHERASRIDPGDKQALITAWLADDDLHRKIRVCLGDPARYTPLLPGEITLVWQSRALVTMLAGLT